MCIYMDEERVMLGMAAPFGQAVGLLAMVRWWWVVGDGFRQRFRVVVSPTAGGLRKFSPCFRALRTGRSTQRSGVRCGRWDRADETIDYGSRGIMPVCDFDADGVAVDLKPLAKVWLVLIDEF